MDEKYDLSYNEFFKDKDISTSIDPLTGVLDRRGFFEYVDWLVSQKKPFSFFLIDVDNFKNINDTYGHIVGDLVLTQTAQAFVSVCGQKGVVGRFGGDEFVIAFENVTEYQDVWLFGNKLAKINLEGLDEYGLPNFTVTVTTGISRFPLNADNVGDMLNIADKALYRGKNKGRNCFIIYLPEKHANISLQGDRDKRLKLMQLSYGVFNNLTACGEDISTAISTVFKSFVSYYMYDHICIETHKKLNFSVIFPLSLQKKFSHIPYEALESIVNTTGYSNINDVEELNVSTFPDIVNECKNHGIMSALYCKITAYGKDYGFIRVDTTSTARIWQNEEMSMVIVAARAIGLLLHYQGKTLEDLPIVAPVEVGGGNANT
ncbi:MAG: GGDEF domain-containing protein [Candidatus Coproplasma sp.]